MKNCLQLDNEIIMTSIQHDAIKKHINLLPIIIIIIKKTVILYQKNADK